MNPELLRLLLYRAMLRDQFIEQAVYVHDLRVRQNRFIRHMWWVLLLYSGLSLFAEFFVW